MRAGAIGALAPNGGISAMQLINRVMIAVAAMLLAGSPSGSHAQTMKTIRVAEPSHGIATLPFYIAMAKGYFAEEGLDVQLLTTDGGGAHANAVLSGQAFAFIGGPEHNAFAKAKGADLRAVVNINDRATAYLVAKKGEEPQPGQSMGDYFRGRGIAVGLYGGTPNSILRNLLGKWGLNAKSDVTLYEMASSAVLAAVRSGNATVAVAPEPFLTQGIRGGIWNEPFYSIPKELGPYAYTTLNVRLASIRDEPDTVRRLVRGTLRGLAYTYANPEASTDFAKKEFPTMPIDDLNATLARSFVDEAWSWDGLVSEQSWGTASRIVLEAGILKQPISLSDISDMQFVLEQKPTSAR